MYINQFGWDEEKVLAFRRDLLGWYDRTKRDLPWRRTQNPYHIWISEIMLQQTQVNTVIPYFNRFIQALPTIEALAQVEDEALLNLWQGLGYYSRARNLKVAANQIIDEYGGQMPQTMKGLLSLKGIGPYTAAAIGSIAFGLVEPAIDGNLFRVTARLFELDADIALPSSRKIFEKILYDLIDPDRPGDFNQAMMDLGARIMTPTNYYPVDSPVKEYDASFINETASLYPVKTKKIKQTSHYYLAFYLLDADDRVLWRKHESQELLSDLWHFPMIEVDKETWQGIQEGEEKAANTMSQAYIYTVQPLLENILDQMGLGDLTLDWQEDWLWTGLEGKVVKHIFSHRIWQVQVIGLNYQGFFPDRKDIEDLATSRPISKLQEKLIKEVKLRR